VYGPLARLDPQRPGPSGPQLDPDGRSVLYLAADVVTAACEVFGEAGEARLCPNWRVGLVRPARPLTLFDLEHPGSALAIGALPSLADGAYPRALTQAWARAIYEDDPLGLHAAGVHYRSAYNGGASLALWDAGSWVRSVVRAGITQDFALRDPAVLARLQGDLAARRIAVTVVGPERCSSCRGG
jgi:hypothetical protein